MNQKQNQVVLEINQNTQRILNGVAIGLTGLFKAATEIGGGVVGIASDVAAKSPEYIAKAREQGEIIKEKLDVMGMDMKQKALDRAIESADPGRIAKATINLQMAQVKQNIKTQVQQATLSAIIQNMFNNNTNGEQK